MTSLSNLSGLENLADRIEVEEIYTPEDFERQFNAYRGATFGLQPTLMQSNHFRPQSKSKVVEGLYFTGSSTHPGAGVPIALEGGKICADEVIKDWEGKA
ncbi:phytoene desaturase family protein [Streptococcus caprae]|uniref:Phytoene desaturase family protein n=1 Tax=Streptococcus caprae TaxID=1640501 RepID=A0ABV8CXP8_9STRE